ncbi:MAG: efflux RND transporter periplasmic adaptor subunit [Candidatus Rokuibacteriota bacterium]|nr:MAG: efflux RND transporter periplasmic adaptor subunit [Candidatus Rokubacteria bacterium]
MQGSISVRHFSLVLSLIAATCLTACNTTSGEAPGSGGRGGRGRGGRGGAAISIDTTTLQRISIQRQVDLSGTLLSPDQARVSSEVGGIILDVPVQLGSEVRPRDILVRLDTRELQLAVDRAESALRQVEAQLGIDRGQDKQPPADDQIASIRQAIANRDDARNAFKRADQLHGRGLMSQVDYDTSETRLKVAEANYQAAIDGVRSLKASLQDRRAAFELAQKKLNDAVVRAPVAGSIAERLVQPGEYIRENTPVATIVQMNPLKLKTAIQERHAGLIRGGQTVEFFVEAFPDRKFIGKIAYVSPAVDQTTRTFPVEAIVDNPDRVLKPGFFARGTALTKVDANVLAVPETAISTLAGVSTVYVIEHDKARQQQVSLGARQDRLVEIVAGLKGDETLATTNLNQLATGVAVRVERSGSRAGSQE